MSEYERLTMDEGDHDDRRYRQRTLQRWRLSMVLAFCSGCMVTMVVYPRVQPCPDLHTVARAAAARCPACPACSAVDTSSIVSKAVEQAVSRCPVCPKCPDFPGCPSCPAGTSCPPAPACPSCDVKCPTVRSGRMHFLGTPMSSAVAAPDADVAARHRLTMLSRPMRNIIECSADAKDDSCRMSPTNRFKVLGQKGATLWLTGLSGAGKTTITKALERRLLLGLRKNVYNVDGDNLRTGLTRDLGFSSSDRAESVRRASEVSQLFSESGVITVVTLISPYRKDRDAARAAHEKRGIPFIEVFLDVPLSVVKARDPKGLYAKVAKGMIKNFTGIDAPYEAPLKPEVTLKTHELPIEKSVDVLIEALRRRGMLSGQPDAASGLTSPDGGELVNMIVPAEQLPAKLAEAATLPQVPLTDLDVNWLQVIGEGWAAPLKGFMREGTLVQCLHFNSMLVDMDNFTGYGGYATKPTNWMQDDFPPDAMRVSMPVPIVLPITDFTKRMIKGAGAVTLVNSAGQPLAILRQPETYELRVRELMMRTWGTIDDEHPYMKELLAPGKDYALGGEVELLGKITYNDGLDNFRLTVDELRATFKKKGADPVYAFQTRNPTHAGHAFLMKDSRKRLMAKGYKNPVLWLSPLGGWTKKSDVPLDVRVSQHKEVMAAGELHPDWTVMAIWPSPMIYAGPREVLFHAKSRRVGGASFFTVGRDPAGMPYSSEPPYPHTEELDGEDIYHADHGRYVLMSSPGVGDMKFLGFSKVYYDKQDHTMRTKDSSRPDDFISISGSKMRKLAALGAKPCPLKIPSDLIAAKCIPPGFMVEKGWNVVSDYYIRQKTGDWVPYSKQLGGLSTAPNVRTSTQTPYGKASFAATFVGADGVTPISPWHDLELYPQGAGSGVVNFMCEIPKGVTAKLEVQKKIAHNPIMQDTKKGKLRHYTYGPTFFNYGMLPRTWEDPAKKGFNGTVGDNDPLDVMEIGSKPFKVGEVRPVKVLGDLELIDQGELDHKILVIDVNDPLASKLNTAADLKTVMPGTLEKLVEWLKFYKTTDGKAVNALSSDEPKTAAEASKVIAECHESWTALKARGAGDTGFWLKP